MMFVDYEKDVGYEFWYWCYVGNCDSLEIFYKNLFNIFLNN